MRNDVTTYMRYYNLKRLHTANGDLSPVKYEQISLKKVSWISYAEHFAFLVFLFQNNWETWRKKNTTTFDYSAIYFFYFYCI
jgi:hypothetical protein